MKTLNLSTIPQRVSTTLIAIVWLAQLAMTPDEPTQAEQKELELRYSTYEIARDQAQKAVRGHVRQNLLMAPLTVGAVIFLVDGLMRVGMLGG